MMYLKLQSKKIPIKEYKTLKERFKVLKFDLNKLDYVICFPNKRYLSTYFFCQKIDVCFTDHNNKVLYIHEQLKSEKRILHLKANKIWILPLGNASKLKIGDTLKIDKK